METMLVDVSCWHWFALGLLLLIAEMAGAGGYLLWTGLAAGITGICLLLFPLLAWQWQMVIFSISTVALALLWWKHQLTRSAVVEEPLLNRRSAQYVGRVFTLSDPIENGRGKIRVDDSFWEVAAAEDMAAGQRVKVVALEHDQIFRVERI